jgi:hypothetical protein
MVWLGNHILLVVFAGSCRCFASLFTCAAVVFAGFPGSPVLPSPLLFIFALAIHCFLFVICCSLCTVRQGTANGKRGECRTVNGEWRRRMFAICHLPFTVLHSPFTFAVVCMLPFSHLAFGFMFSLVPICHSPFAIRHVSFAIRRSPFAVRRSPFAVRRSPFAVRRSPFAVRRSPFAVRRSPCVIRHLSFAFRCLPFTVCFHCPIVFGFPHLGVRSDTLRPDDPPTAALVTIEGTNVCNRQTRVGRRGLQIRNRILKTTLYAEQRCENCLQVTAYSVKYQSRVN